jgi:hypothetical protein
MSFAWSAWMVLIAYILKEKRYGEVIYRERKESLPVSEVKTAGPTVFRIRACLWF